MKETPILFTAPMVRAILAGTKTQTRRLVSANNSSVDGWSSRKAWPDLRFDQAYVDNGPSPAGNPGPYLKVPRADCVHRVYPRWQPGQRLWVREAFNLGRPMVNAEGVADDEQLWIGRLPKEDPRKQFMKSWCVGYAADGCEGKMRPSIHMPRWASRITLEVTDVRVERVRNISEEDALAEGAEAPDTGSARALKWTARDSFAVIWTTINGDRASWESNPWVWAVSFRRLET